MDQVTDIARDFIDKTALEVEIETLKYCVKLMKKYPANMVIGTLENYIKELENE